MIKEIGNFNAGLFKSEYEKIESQIVWGFETDKGKQAALQYREGEDIWKGAVDRGKGKELEYDIINPIFKDTIFEELINKYNLKRTRFMWLNRWSCYSLHRDLTPRIHFPIYTNNQCFLIFKNATVENLKEGTIYYTDTRHLHTAMNGSEEKRLHLVGAVDALNFGK
jgi:hypothetical protein